MQLCPSYYARSIAAVTLNSIVRTARDLMRNGNEKGTGVEWGRRVGSGWNGWKWKNAAGIRGQNGMSGRGLELRVKGRREHYRVGP